MSFYVTLPSNASMDAFKDNKTSNFRTLLSSPIRLDGSWQVAIVGFSYRHEISTIIGRLDIYSMEQENFGKKINSVDIKAYEGELFTDVIDRINVSLAETNSGIQINRSETHTNLLQFEMPADKKIRITGMFYDIIGFPPSADGVIPVKQTLFGNGDTLEHKFRATDTTSRNEFFFFYTDIIVDQIVGDTMAKLLDTHALQGKKGDAISVQMENPHYVDLAKTEISTINITILDSTGENIHFENLSRVIVKLHFRPKRYE